MQEKWHCYICKSWNLQFIAYRARRAQNKSKEKWIADGEKYLIFYQSRETQQVKNDKRYSDDSLIMKEQFDLFYISLHQKQNNNHRRKDELKFSGVVVPHQMPLLNNEKHPRRQDEGQNTTSSVTGVTTSPSGQCTAQSVA